MMELATEPGSPVGTASTDTGATPQDWRATLPEHYEVKDATGAATKIPLRGDATLAQYKTGEEAARALIEQRKMIGRGIPQVPGPDAKPEERTAFFDALNRPKDATGYAGVKAPDGVLPDGVQAFVQNVAVPGRWAPEDVQAAVNFLGEYQARQMKDTIMRWDEGQEALRSEWGYNFTRNEDISKRFIAESFKKAGVGDELPALLDKIGIGHHPDFIKWAHMMATHATEDVFVPGAPDAKASEDSMDAQIREVDQQIAKMTPGSPGYAEVEARRTEMYKRRFGNQPVGT
jgi:hypothetical protein